MENAQPEPSMEEILASIRRIISEDDEEGAATGEAQKAAPAGENEKSAVNEPTSPAAFVPGPAQTPEFMPSQTPAAQDETADAPLKLEDVQMVNENTAAAFTEEFNQENIIADSTAQAAATAFTSLSQSVRVSEGPGRTLEDIVTEMLKPMIKEWLDANLPAIVEEKVEDEVQRVARRRSR